MAIIAIVGLSTATVHAQTLAPTKLGLGGKNKETQRTLTPVPAKDVASVGAKEDRVQVITRETPPAKSEPEVITKLPAQITKQSGQAKAKDSGVVTKEATRTKPKEPEVVTREPTRAVAHDSAKPINREPSKAVAQKKAMEPVRPITHYTYQTPDGRRESAPVITHYYPKQIVHPFAKIDRHLDPKLMRAATIAQERAHAHSRSMCWHYVKEALLASGVIDSRPKSELAKDAAQDLVSNYGFKKLPVNDPFAAPIGSVLVYGSRRAAGHVELRTRDGFVSDFRSPTPSRRPLIGVYAKL